MLLEDDSESCVFELKSDTWLIELFQNFVTKCTNLFYLNSQYG